jgi:hypothetical protein
VLWDRFTWMIEVEGRVINKWALERGVWLATHLPLVVCLRGRML